MLLLAAALFLQLPAKAAAELRISEGTNIAASVNPHDGRVAMDLLGALWIVPARGGDAEPLLRQLAPASRPRWSPDGHSLLYQSNGPSGSALWTVDVNTRDTTRLSPTGASEQHGAWHPSGERVVFVAGSDDGGLDLWERDLATGLAWRLTRHPGDETEPAWSSDGRHLVYVLQDEGRWHLVLRPFGKPPRVLLQQDRPIHAPAWRPDNTLLTYLAAGDDGQLALNMLILSEPPLARTLVTGEDLFIAPPSWQGRGRFVYTANGVIRSRHFEDRESRVLPFSAEIPEPRRVGARASQAARPLPDEPVAVGTVIIRAPRVFDGVAAGYRHDVDIVIENGRITAVEPQRDREGATVFDIGNVTVTPGLIDAYAALPDNITIADGPLLLALGVTTLVTPDRPAFDATAWSGTTWPGPRLLRALDIAAPTGRSAEADRPEVRLLAAAGSARLTAQQRDRLQRWHSRGVPLLAENWYAGLAMGADLLLGGRALPSSPWGRRYADIETLAGGGPLLLVSAAADAGTAGLHALRQTPPARRLGESPAAPRRLVDTAGIARGNGSVVVGSRPSRLPPGIATQAEVLALHAAGLPADQALRAATANAADALQLHGELGRIEAGARADLLLVAGDPLRNPADLREVVAVVRNGRFYSTASLLDAHAASVE